MNMITSIKPHLWHICAAALLLGATSCSSEEIARPDSNKDQPKLHLLVDAQNWLPTHDSRVTLEDRAADRTLVKNWEGNENATAFAIFYPDRSVPQSVTMTGNGTLSNPYSNSSPLLTKATLTNITGKVDKFAEFSGDVPAEYYQTGQQLALFYPSVENNRHVQLYSSTNGEVIQDQDSEAEGKTPKYTRPDMRIEVQHQDGLLETIQKEHFYMIGLGEILKVEGQSASAHLGRMLQLSTLAKFFFYNGNISQPLTDISSVKIEGLISVVNVSFSGESFTWHKDNTSHHTINITDFADSNRNYVYISMFAGSRDTHTVSPKFTVMAGGKTYTAQLPAAHLHPGAWYDGIHVVLQQQ